MNYSAIHTDDFVNGEGMRVSLFVSGCIHACKGCYNQKTWSPDFGEEFTEEVFNHIIKELERHDGLSLSGGDPMYPGNRETLEWLCSQVKEVYPEKDIWLWTGFTLAELAEMGVDPKSWGVDVIIDGKYEEDNPTTKPWRGSDNQILTRFVE